MNSIISAPFAIESKGPSIDVSMPSPIQKMTSASSSIFAWDGFIVKLCGDILPSIISPGSPVPPITFAINEWRGLIVVTTFISALTGAVAISKNEKIVTFNKFSR